MQRHFGGIPDDSISLVSSLAGSHASGSGLQRIHPRHVGREETFQFLAKIGFSEEDVQSDSFMSIEDDDSVYRLHYFYALLILTTIEDIIQSLQIVDECNSAMRIHKTLLDLPKLKAQKYGINPSPVPHVVDELAGIDMDHLDKSEYKIKKASADREYMVTVFTALYIDLAGKRSFKVLHDYLDTLITKNQYITDLQYRQAEYRLKYRQLGRSLRTTRNNNKRATLDINAEIGHLTSQVGESELSVWMQSRYVDNWQNARSECHDATIAEKETAIGDSIQYYKNKATAEDRAHQQIETLYESIISNKLTETEDLMDKYEGDMEALDLKLQIKTLEYKNLVDYRKSLEEKIEKHKKEMKNWLEYKENRRQDFEYKQKMYESAIIVQAWWRGILVRRHLGPYRPKKNASKNSKAKKSI